MKEYGVGIIGMGYMGKTHAFAHATMPYYYENLPFKTRLIGACNRSLPAAEYARDFLGFEYATTNEDDIFSDKRIDLVHICTPNEAHFSQVKKALQAGKHVYCDKPLALNFEQCRELWQLAQKSGKTAQMGFQSRFFPATLQAYILIKQGKIGKIINFTAKFLHSGSLNPQKPIGWKQTAQGGVLRDLASHAVDLMSHFVGDFDSVFARSRVLYPARPDKTGQMVDITAEDHATMLLTQSSGAIGFIEASKIATGADDDFSFEIRGTKGALAFSHTNPRFLYFFDNTKPDAAFGGERGYTAIECASRFNPPGGKFPGIKVSPGWLRAHCHSIYSFVDNAHNGHPGNPSFADGAYTQYIIDLALESAASNGQVKAERRETIL